MSKKRRRKSGGDDADGKIAKILDEIIAGLASTLTLVYATGARLHGQLLCGGHHAAGVPQGVTREVQPNTTCVRLAHPDAGKGKEGLGRKSRGKPGGELKPSKQRGGLTVLVEGTGQVWREQAAEEWAEQGSVPRVTGLRMLEEPASSKEIRHGGWMF